MYNVEHGYLVTRAARAELVGEWLGAIGQVTALNVGSGQAWQVTQNHFVGLQHYPKSLSAICSHYSTCLHNLPAHYNLPCIFYQGSGHPCHH